MKFGGKHTIQSRMAAAESRLGKTTGASKGKAPVSAKPKIKPTVWHVLELQAVLLVAGGGIFTLAGEISGFRMTSISGGATFSAGSFSATWS